MELKSFIHENGCHIPSYNLDWSTGHVRGPELDRSLVDIKFKLFDHCVDYYGMMSPQVLDLLEDDTIYAYAFLNFSGKKVKLRYYQDAVINDGHRIIDVEAANQQGKTFTLCVKAAVSFLRDHNKNWTIALISRTRQQNGTNMRMIKQMLGQANIDWSAGVSDSQSVTTRDVEGDDGNVMYTNTLICAVAGGGALGLPCDLLLLDEFEFWVEDSEKNLAWYFDQIFYPRTFDTRGQIVIYSNPNGRNFVSEDLQKRRKDSGEYVCHTYNINFLDNPNNTREEYEQQRKLVHPIIFASTMAAERTEAEGSALTAQDIESTFDENLQRMGKEALRDRENLAFFADLGFVYDQTVVTGGYSVVEFNEVTKREEAIFYFVPKCYPVGLALEDLWAPKDSPGSVAHYVMKYSDNPYFELDLTGKEGNELNARAAGLSCNGVKMSGQWKAEHYERFISLCKQGRIKVFIEDNWLDGKNKDFQFQARSLQISTKKSDGTNRNYPLYHHTTEKDHDDILDSVVGCLSMLDGDMHSSGHMAFFPAGETEEQEEEDMHETAHRLNKQNSQSLFYGGHF